MNQEMKNNNFIAIKLNPERIIIAFLLIFSIFIMFRFSSQNNEIKRLEYEIKRFEHEILIENKMIKILNSRVYDLEYQNSDLEGQIDDLLSRIEDLESYHYY